jgi:hypothetical protein
VGQGLEGSAGRPRPRAAYHLRRKKKKKEINDAGLASATACGALLVDNHRVPVADFHILCAAGLGEGADLIRYRFGNQGIPEHFVSTCNIAGGVVVVAHGDQLVQGLAATPANPGRLAARGLADVMIGLTHGLEAHEGAGSGPNLHIPGWGAPLGDDVDLPEHAERDPQNGHLRMTLPLLNWILS